MGFVTSYFLPTPIDFSLLGFVQQDTLRVFYDLLSLLDMLGK